MKTESPATPLGLTANIAERRKVVRKALATTMLSKPAPCQCKQCNPIIHRFKCHECLRITSWCYGGSGDDWEGDACNTCWSIITAGGTIEVKR